MVFDAVGGDEYYHRTAKLLKPGKAAYVTAVGPVLHGGSEPIGISTILGAVSTLLPRAVYSTFSTHPYLMFLSVRFQVSGRRKRNRQPKLQERTQTNRDATYSARANGALLRSSRHARNSTSARPRSQRSSSSTSRASSKCRGDTRASSLSRISEKRTRSWSRSERWARS